MDIQSVSAIIFLVLLAAVLFLNRKRLEVQKVIGPVVYILMYKTQAGIAFMDRMAKRVPRTIRYLGYAGIVLGFIGMALVSFSLVQNLYSLLFIPASVSGVALVLPFKVKGTFFVPFFYWIISIFMLVIVHEFSHGVVSRAYSLRIKSSGLAFLGIGIPVIPAAFVEPDEKELKKRPALQQLSIFAAGSFSNILFAFLMIIFLLGVVNPLVDAAVDYDGVKVAGFVRSENNNSLAAEAAGISVGEVITGLDGQQIFTPDNLSDVLGRKSAGDRVTVTTNRTDYSFALSQNPENSSLAYLGIHLQQQTKMNSEFGRRYGAFAFSSLMWVVGLVMWLYILNLGIGLFNLLPIPITDGGRMFYTAAAFLFKDEAKANKIWKFVALFFIVVLIMNIGAGFIR